MSELEDYKAQLADIEESLAADPENESLLSLKSELLELIGLLEQDEKEEPSNETPPEPDVTRTEPSPAPSDTPTPPPFTPGETIWAKTKLDKQYKEAKIITLSGNNKMATIQFLATTTTETVPVDQLHKEKPKDLVSKYKKQQERASKPNPKDEKYEQDLNKSAQSWQSFTKKTKKKSKSQFSTSNTVGSKVGVLGSGKPMTVEKKKKNPLHRYTPY